MKSIVIHVTGEKNDGTTVSKTQTIKPSWASRETKAEMLERAERAALSAVRSMFK